VGEKAVDQAIALYYAALASAEFGENSALNKCQRTIGKATQVFLKAKSKALQKCSENRLKGQHENACLSPGDGKAQATLEKAEARKIGRYAP